jgi:hypothetical protein
VVRLAGMPKDTTLTPLLAFRTGERPATVMHPITRGDSQAQLDELVGHFAARSEGDTMKNACIDRRQWLQGLISGAVLGSGALALGRLSGCTSADTPRPRPRRPWPSCRAWKSIRTRC